MVRSMIAAMDSDIVRPIAFRPMMVSSGTKSSGNGDRESMSSSDGRTPTASSYLFNTRPSQSGRQLSSADTESASAYVVAGGHSATPNRVQPESDFSRVMAKPFVTPPTAYVHRPKPIYQPSTSTGGAASATAPSQTYPAKRADKEKDDDYDIVPEFVDLLKQHLIDNDVYNQQAHQPKQHSSHSSPGSHNSHQHRANNGQTTIGPGGQMQNSSRQVVYPNNASNTGSFGSRQSSGIHVTPSPSDSGVADFE
uniref:Uncharacterized protein n=1 Tax=Plectus sambesii TaxID=2011161 RepID=A0A914WTM8_9BILA